MIRKTPTGEWKAVAKTTGRSLGTYSTKEAAEKRAQQSEMFKEMAKKGTIYKNVKKGKK